MTVAELLRAIKRLPADPPVHDPRKWYRTQKEHWIGWLDEYDGPGAYGRKTPQPHRRQERLQPHRRTQDAPLARGSRQRERREGRGG